MPSDDTTVIRSLAVTAEDVVAALEANRTRSDAAVLRVTPPFSGRMRARLHRADLAADADPEALHVPPERFVDSPPPVPSPDDTEDAVRADPAATYDPETHRRRHEAALRAWRDDVRAALVDRTTIETPAGPRRLRRRSLGDSPAGFNGPFLPCLRAAITIGREPSIKRFPLFNPVIKRFPVNYSSSKLRESA